MTVSYNSRAAPCQTDRRRRPVDIPVLMADIYHDGVCAIGKSSNHRDHAVSSPSFVGSPGSTLWYFIPSAALMGRPARPADRDAAAVALESYLVRRIVCWERYARLQRCDAEPAASDQALDSCAPAAPAIAKALAEQSAEAYRWPDDEKFRNAWVHNASTAATGGACGDDAAGVGRVLSTRGD